MIGKIKGILSEINDNTVLIETSGGVYYESYVNTNILSHFKINSPVEFYTYLQVRDDALVLYSFETRDEYALFELLLSVSGVGPKTAYLVISYGKPQLLIQAVKDNDIEYFSQIRGLGKKTGMKIILELSQKLKQEFELNKMNLNDSDKIIVDALISLGFRTHEARTAVQKLPKGIEIEDAITQALKMLK